MIPQRNQPGSANQGQQPYGQNSQNNQYSQSRGQPQQNIQR